MATDLDRSDLFRPPPSPGRALSARLTLVLLWLGGAGVSTLALVSAPHPVRFDLPLIAHVAGLLAGYAVTIMVLLMSRAPALERGIGADRLARWHGRLGPIILIAIVVHGVAATVAWGMGRGEDVVSSTADVMSLPGLIAAFVATALFIAVAAFSAAAARKRLRYETWHLIHLLTYLAIALSFAHELAGPDLAGYPIVQIAWSLLYTISFALLIRYRVLAPLLQTWRHGLRVERVVPEGARVVSVVVRGDHLDELEAEAGQFFRWRFLTRRTWMTAHPFSLSAPPGPNHLRLTVKAVGDGTRLIPAVRPGTIVIAEGPYGAMTERRRSRHGVLLIAGGVGITPMRALFENMTIAEGPLTLLYRASSERDLIFRRELEEIAAVRGAELIYLTGRSTDPAVAMNATTLLHRVPDVAHRDVYLCASPAFAGAVRAALFDAGLPKHRLHHEQFSF